MSRRKRPPTPATPPLDPGRACSGCIFWESSHLRKASGREIPPTLAKAWAEAGGKLFAFCRRFPNWKETERAHYCGEFQPAPPPREPSA